MPLPDKYDRNPVNETDPGGEVCEGWVRDEKTQQVIHCPRKPDWVVHSNFRKAGNDKVCDENFYCDKHFFEKHRPTTEETSGITFVEYGYWLKGDRNKLTRGVPVTEPMTEPRRKSKQEREEDEFAREPITEPRKKEGKR